MPIYCTIRNCQKSIHCKDLCNTHYRRLLRHGDPEACEYGTRISLSENPEKYKKKRPKPIDKYGPEGRLPVKPRLIRKSSIDPVTGCWLWSGALDGYGYGILQVNGKRKLAHRASYEQHVGPIPVGLTIDHLCRVRNCINPAHMEPVTSEENTRRGIAGHLQAAKTHCPKGHEYNGKNLRIYKGWRHCRECSRIKSKEWRQKRRLQVSTIVPLENNTQ